MGGGCQRAAVKLCPGAVPGPEFVAFGAVHRGPRDGDLLESGGGGQDGLVGHHIAGDLVDAVGPAAGFTVAVDSADLVVVGGAAGKRAMTVAGASQGGSAELSPFVYAVPGPEFVAGSVIDVVPREVDCVGSRGLRCQCGCSGHRTLRIGDVRRIECDSAESRQHHN